MVSGTRKNRKNNAPWSSLFAHLTQRPCYILMLLNFQIMQKYKKNILSPVQTINERPNSLCIVGRVLKNQSITKKANAEIIKHYKNQPKKVIINDLVNDFQEKSNYELFLEELGLVEIFDAWKTINFIKKEIINE